MPTEEEKRETANHIAGLFYIPQFVFGEDGMFVGFEDEPRGLLVGPDVNPQVGFPLFVEQIKILEIFIKQNKIMLNVHDARVWVK